MNKFLFSMIFFLSFNLNAVIESQGSGARGYVLFEILHNYLLGGSLKAEMETDKVNYCKLKRIDIVEWFFSIGPSFAYKTSNSFIHNVFIFIDCEFGCKSFCEKRYPTSWYFHSIKIAFNFLIELFQLPIFSVNFNFGRATDSENYKEQNAFYYSVSGSIVGFSNIKGRIYGGVSLFFGANFANNISSEKVKELRKKIWTDYEAKESEKAKIILDYARMCLKNKISDFNINYLKLKINSINLTSEVKYVMNYIDIMDPVNVDHKIIKNSFNEFNQVVKNFKGECFIKIFKGYYTFIKDKALESYLSKNNILLNSITYLKLMTSYNFKNPEDFINNIFEKIKKPLDDFMNSDKYNLCLVVKNFNLFDLLLVTSILCKILNEDFVYENLHSFLPILSSKEKDKFEKLSKDTLTEDHLSILEECLIKVVEDIKFKKIPGYNESIEFLGSLNFFCN